MQKSDVFRKLFVNSWIMFRMRHRLTLNSLFELIRRKGANIILISLINCRRRWRQCDFNVVAVFLRI